MRCLYKKAKVRYTVIKRNCYFTEFVFYRTFEFNSVISIMSYLWDKHHDADKISIEEIEWNS
jgi:hypothetical protein